MGLEERWQRTLALWPYVVPLITVYFAEYSMQVSWILTPELIGLLQPGTLVISSLQISQS